MKNKIFVIEGTDGSGKQTQTHMLAQFLQSNGQSVITQSFPNYNSLSSGPIKMYLDGELGKTAGDVNAYQASALFAVDRFCTTKTLLKDIGSKDIIIFDRYVESNLIHQACKINDIEERNRFMNWLYDFEYNALKLPKPTKVFFLNMPPKHSIALAHSRLDLKAGTAKDIHEQDSDYLISAYQTGLWVAKKMGWSIINCVNENGIRTPQEINKEITNEISKILEEEKIK